jgi:hypothetical protein
MGSGECQADSSTTYYHASSHFPSSKDFENAEVAFENARTRFELQGTRDPRKKDRLHTLKTTTMDDLLNAVKDAQEDYHQRRTESAFGRYMDQLAERIHYYGNIMDVLVQHHPEFTSLAWGAMKLLVGVRDSSSNFSN